MIAVRRRCRLPFVRGALETPHTPQKPGGYGRPAAVIRLLSRVLLGVFDGRGSFGLL
jgi:hypothetical protein